MVKVLLFLHHAAAFSTLAVAIHLVVRLARWQRRPAGYHSRVRQHAMLVAIGYLVTLALGLLIYPPFRLHVRHAFMDQAFPLGTGLFEIKEHLAALGIIPALGLLWLARRIGPLDPPPPAWRAYYWMMTGSVLGILVYNTVIGWYLVTVRSV